MTGLLALLARGVLQRIPLPAYQACLRRHVVAFVYHLVGPPGLAHVSHLYAYKSPGAFERDLDHLERRYRLVGCNDLDSPRRRWARPAAHLTFDDGYAECDTVVRPMLLRRGIPCTFFLTTDPLDNRCLPARNRCALCIEAIERLGDNHVTRALRALEPIIGHALPDRAAFRRAVLGLDPADVGRIDRICACLEVDAAAYLREHRPFLTSAQILRMAAEGFTIGAHGRRHLPLDSVEDAVLEDEIAGSCRWIAGLTGRTPVPFAFPHSADGVDRAALQRLRDRHPQVGRLFDTRRLRRDVEFICNRIVADAPPLDESTTNLPMLLHAAYREAAAEALRTWPRRWGAAHRRPTGEQR